MAVSFDPRRHTLRIRGNRDYITVAGRLVQFRTDHPDYGIVTEAKEIDVQKGFAHFYTCIFNTEGRVVATGTGTETRNDFVDFVEKAESKSVGRALVFLGYGTDYLPDLEDAEEPAPAPAQGQGGRR